MSARRDSALLWTPADTRQERRTHFCRICGEDVAETERSRHVDRCYRANEHELRSSSPAHQHPLLFGNAGVDTEFMEWHRTNPKGENFQNGS